MAEEGLPANDNLQAANDNRSEYQRALMRWRRRHPGKTQRSLLRASLALVEAHAPMDDPEARMFIEAVKELFDDTVREAKNGRQRP